VSNVGVVRQGFLCLGEVLGGLLVVEGVVEALARIEVVARERLTLLIAERELTSEFVEYPTTTGRRTRRFVVRGASGGPSGVGG
jgi:hypothetical protein